MFCHWTINRNLSCCHRSTPAADRPRPRRGRTFVALGGATFPPPRAPPARDGAPRRDSPPAARGADPLKISALATNVSPLRGSRRREQISLPPKKCRKNPGRNVSTGEGTRSGGIYHAKHLHPGLHPFRLRRDRTVQYLMPLDRSTFPMTNNTFSNSTIDGRTGKSCPPKGQSTATFRAAVRAGLG